MAGPQQHFQGFQQGSPGGGLLGGLGLRVPEQRLGQFQIPVAVFVPGEFVEGVGVQVEAVGGQGLLAGGDQAAGAGANPAVRQAGLRRALQIVPARMHQHEPGRIPQLVAEIAVAFGAAEVEAQVPPGGGEGAEGEAQGVRAVGRDALREIPAGVPFDAGRHLRLRQVLGALLDQFFQADAVDQVQGVQAVAFGLGHLAALGVAHQAVDIYLAEGRLAGELQGHHDHAGDPEEDDVVAGHQGIRGVEALEILGLPRPAQGGKGPQSGGEPGVQHIRVLGQRRLRPQLRLAPRLRFAAADMGIARFVVVGRNPVPPPELAADAPVLDVPHPGEEQVGVLGGHELHFAAAHRGHRGLGEGRDFHEPLVGQPGFDGRSGAVAPGHRQPVLLYAFEQPQAVQVGDDALARLEPIQAPVSVRRRLADGRLGRENVDQGQAVAGAQLVVVEIMGRRDLDAAGAELRVHPGIRDDGQFPAHQGQARLAADQASVALVLWMHGQGGVAQHGFRAGGGDCEKILAVRRMRAVAQGVAEAPQAAILLPVLDFQIGNGGAQFRVPVDQPLAPVDQAFLVQADEHFDHCAAEALVQREALPGPIHGGAHAPQLARDMAPGGFFPAPNPLLEGAAANFGAALALGVQLPLHQHLGGDAGMVRARLPERSPAAHPLVADQHVHQAVLEGMPHVQAAGDIGRRNGDAVALALAGWREQAGFLPLPVQLALDGMGVEAAVHLQRLPRNAAPSLPIDPARDGTGDSPDSGSACSVPARWPAARRPRFPPPARTG